MRPRQLHAPASDRRLRRRRKRQPRRPLARDAKASSVSDGSRGVSATMREAGGADPLEIAGHSRLRANGTRSTARHRCANRLPIQRIAGRQDSAARHRAERRGVAEHAADVVRVRRRRRATTSGARRRSVVAIDRRAAARRARDSRGECRWPVMPRKSPVSQTKTGTSARARERPARDRDRAASLTQQRPHAIAADPRDAANDEPAFGDEQAARAGELGIRHVAVGATRGSSAPVIR